MSSTPVERSGSSSRPASITTRVASVAADPATSLGRTGSLAWKDERSAASPLARAFPAIRIDTDVMVLIAVVFVSLIMRLIWLGDRPLHHDESLHATYAWYLMGRANPEYHYDPMMHGPLQFHMMAFFYSIFGSSPFSARLWSVTAGTGLVAVPWLLRRQLGRWQMFALMAILSLSPVTLYFSRFAREDMQFALFTFLMVATLLRYITDHTDGSRYHYRWLYLFGVATGMAYAAKESIYLNVAMLCAFLAVIVSIELLRGYWLAAPLVGVAMALFGIAGGNLLWTAAGGLLIVCLLIYHIVTNPRTGPVSQAMRDTPLHAWLLGAAPLVALFVLLYWPIGDPWQWAFIPGSHMVQTTLDIPGLATPKPYSYSTDGLIGGLQYWQAQQPVARGGQPWFYYLLIIPMYEWLVTLFGIVGAVYVLMKKRNISTILILSWTIASFLIYGWTSEKMPWNSLHLVVPLAVLASIGLVAAVTAARRWLRYLAIVLAVITGLFSTHNALTLAYVNGASPVEYMVYVQTTPDVPKDFSSMQQIQEHLDGPMHVLVDNDEEWPWVFYLRDTSTFITDNYPTTPADYGTPTQPVLLVSDENYTAMSSTLDNRYVAFHERLRWWNPEEYKTAYVDRYKWVDTKNPSKACSDPTHVACTSVRQSRLERLGDFIGDAFSPSTWSQVLAWEIQRKPFSPHAWDNFGNSTNFWFLVEKQYVQYLPANLQTQAHAQIAKIEQDNPFAKIMKPLTPKSTYSASQASFTGAGPVAVNAQGDTFVGDESGHRVVELLPSGAVVRTIGTAGTGPGQFNGSLPPSIGGIGIAANGDIYVSDTWNYRVEEFSPKGTFIRMWGRQNLNQTNLKPDDFYGPRGIAVGPDGDVYVADTGHKRIQVFDPNGKFVRSIGQAGSAPGQLNEPSGVAIDASGRLFVADYWNSRVQIFSASGQFQSSFKVPAWQPGQWDEPQITVDKLGRVFVPDATGADILVYSSSGKPLYGWGNGAGARAQFTKPQFAALGADGTILVSDTGSNAIMAFKAP